MKSEATWNTLETAIAEFTLEDGQTLGAAVGKAVRMHPEASTKHLILASISVCSSIDQFVGVANYENLLSSRNRYETIAALAADIAALPSIDNACSHLLQHWMDSEDGMFSQ